MDSVQQPKVYTLVGVHFQKENRGPPNIGQADDVGGFDFEMFRPPVMPGMENRYQRVSVRIAAGEIRPLEQVAVVACESQV